MKRQKLRDIEETEGKWVRHREGGRDGRKPAPSSSVFLPFPPICLVPTHKKGRSWSPSELPVSIPDTQLGCRKRSEAVVTFVSAGWVPSAGHGEEPADLWAGCL